MDGAALRMNIALMYAGRDPSVYVAEAMVQSVRKSNPTARVVQLTDLGSEPLTFVDEVTRRSFSDLIDFRFQHLAHFDRDVACIDYDCIVQRNLDHVFDQPFDIAFTRRPHIDKTASNEAAFAMPHNLGVIFQRPSGNAFWARLCEIWAKLEDKEDWLMGQVVVSDAIQRIGKDFRIIELPGEYYNYTPSSEDEDVRARAIVHYKGRRKHWMVKEGRDDALRAGQAVNDITERGMGRIIARTTGYHPKC